MKKQIIKLIKILNNLRLKKFKIKFKKILDQNKLTFVDIGASIQIIPRWKRIHKDNLNYILFEPNKKEIKKLKLNKKYYSKYKIYESALSNKKQNINLNITKGIYQTSVLKPDMKFLNQFRNADRYQITNKIKIKANRLDSFKIKDVDFIKIDTQGYNYEILEGSIKTLKDTLGVETEVEFTKLYTNQKLFGDVNKILIKNNFDFIDFTVLKRWNRYNNSNYGQCIFSNALFLKKPRLILNLDKKKIIKYISICVLYNKFDLANYVIDHSTLNFLNKKELKNKIKFFNSHSNNSKNLVKIISVINRFIDFENEIVLFQ